MNELSIEHVRPTGKLGLRMSADGPGGKGPRYGSGTVRTFEGAWRHGEGCP
jgi:hypothetical protein